MKKLFMTVVVLVAIAAVVFTSRPAKAVSAPSAVTQADICDDVIAVAQTDGDQTYTSCIAAFGRGMDTQCFQNASRTFTSTLRQQNFALGTDCVGTYQSQ